MSKMMAALLSFAGALMATTAAPAGETWDALPFDGLRPDIDQASGLMTMDGGGKYWKWGEADQ